MAGMRVPQRFTHVGVKTNGCGQSQSVLPQALMLVLMPDVDVLRLCMTHGLPRCCEHVMNSGVSGIFTPLFLG